MGCGRAGWPGDATEQALLTQDVQEHMVSKLKLIWGFLRTRKKWWLTPVVIFMLLLSVLLVLAEGSAVAPFIYAIF